MELHQLRGFVLVARLGSFTRAAEELYLTQPALSLQVKALETELGERLFERGGRRLLLTPAGHILLERAERVLGLVDGARDDIAALRGLAQGRLAIGASDSYCLYLLPEIVRLYRERHPGVELRLTNCTSTEVAGLVADGEVDFGLVTLPIVHHRLTSTPLLAREDVLICAPGHPLSSAPDVTLEDVAAYPLLLLDRGSSRALLDRLFDDAGLVPEIVIELGSVEVIKRYVEIGLGVSIVPSLAIAREVHEGRLRTVRLAWLPPLGIGIVERKAAYRSPAAAAFLELLSERVVQMA